MLLRVKRKEPGSQLRRFSFRAVSGQFLVHAKNARIEMEAGAWSAELHQLPNT